jgi:hypothetical protein
MIYSYDITTPASTAKALPLRTPLQLTKGLIYQVEVEFPPGPLGYHHVTIFDGGHQIWPSNSESSFHGDNGFITFQESYLKLAAPYEFVAVTWNEDDTYEHLTHIRLGLVADEIFMARFLPSISYDKMLEVLRRAQKEQEAAREAALTGPYPWATETED